MIVRLLRLILLAQLIAGAAIGALLMAVAGLSLPQAVLAALASVLLVRATITGHNFVLAHRYCPATRRERPLGALRTAGMFLREFHSTMLCSSWSMAFHTDIDCRYPDSTALPVLLVHGYGCNGGYWGKLCETLEFERISHRAVNLEPVLAPIDEYVPQLREAIAGFLRETRSERVIVLAHSMGGLVARALLREDPQAPVAHVITLGTPHRGTGLANHGLGLNCRQMRWTPEHGPSAWLRALGQGETPALRARFTSIRSRHDNIVSPAASSEFEGARNLALDGVGHVALALHPEVQRLVVEEIRRVG
jgi:triacylglycerol lipase